MKDLEFEKLECTYVKDLENIDPEFEPFRGYVWIRKIGNVIFIERTPVKCEWVNIDESGPYGFLVEE